MIYQNDFLSKLPKGKNIVICDSPFLSNIDEMFDYSKNIFNVFSDFIELMALEMAISIGVEYETRIEQFNKTKSKYNISYVCLL